MGTIAFGAFFAVALFGYGILSLMMKTTVSKAQQTEYVMCVEAGPTASTTAQALMDASYNIRRIPLRDVTGKVINDDTTMRVKVKGECLVPCGINNGDELIVERIDSTKPLKEQIKRGDVLLIHIDDNGINKLRVFDEYTNDGKLRTYRYENGIRKDSTKPHSEESVVGKVRYTI